MSLLLHIADQVLNRPLLITPDKAQVILSVLGHRIGISDPMVPMVDRFEGDVVGRDANGKVDFSKISRFPITAAGVGIVSIVGSLVNRGAYVGASSGLVSYEGIRRQLKDAAANPDVKAVLLDIQSPGGQAIGNFETAAMVRELAAQKPVTAVVNAMAASGGYAIASGARDIVTNETGVSGSIGVVLVHLDYSRYLANEGVKPTIVFAGAHKADANPYEPLPESVRTDLQAETDVLYEMFLATVAKGRGDRLTVDMARATQARTFVGQIAVDAGLADRVGTFESALADLTRQISARAPAARTSSSKGATMTDENRPAATAGIDQATHDAAVTAAMDRGRADGAEAATERLAAVLSADGIKGDGKRMAAALDLAVKSPAMSATDVATFVTGNVAAASADRPETDAATYEQERLATSGQAQPGKKPKASSGLHDRVTRMVEGMKAA